MFEKIWYRICTIFIIPNLRTMKGYYFASVFLMLLLFMSCNSSKNQTFENKVISMLSQEDQLSVFGKVDYNSILNKAEYQSIPNFGTIISSVVSEFSSQIEIKKPIYFSLVGPYSKDGVPNQSIAYVSIKNADSLVSFLTQKGYDFNKKETYYFSQVDDLVVGVSGKIAILVHQEFFKNAEAIIAEKIAFLSKSETNENYQKILSSKGDIVVGYDIEKTYLSSSTSLDKLNKDLKEEVKEMVKDSYGQLSVNFEEGKLVLQTKNYFSEQLKSHFFFKEDNQKSILKELGQGEAKMGLSINLDVEKLQKFIDKYSPDLMNQLSETIGGPFQMAMVMSGEKGLKGLISGKVGLVVFGEPNEFGSIEPCFNAYVGLGKQGYSLAQMGKGFIENSDLKVVLKENGVSCFSSSKYERNGMALKLPVGCENFGKEAISGFANFKDLDLTSFQLEGGAKLIQLIESIHFFMNIEGGEFVINLKDKKHNVLKQVVDFELKEFESHLSNLAF